MKKQRLIPALVFGMAILSISTLANAQVILSLKEAPTLVAKGAGVDVSVQITCNPAVFGGDTFLMFSGGLTQRTGNSTTDGFFSGGGPWTCTGSSQDIDVIAPVTSPRKPFKQGQALLYFGASLFVNGTSISDGANFPLQEIQIRH